jgi:esterase/lipase superfamily enzyme/TRAP-type C4-dicarboxylate transport system substrate-binding protein
MRFQFCSLLRLIACLLCTHFIALPGSARAEPQTVTIVVDASFQTTASQFLERLQQSLPAQAHERFHFSLVPVAPNDIQNRLSSEPWNMAIVSTLTLSEAGVKTPAIGFEIPFLFSSMAKVTQLQRSPIGVSGLSAISSLGGTGLVYLNGGTTLVADLKGSKKPSDLKGQKVAVFSPLEEKQLRNVGSVPVIFAQKYDANEPSGKDKVAWMAINSADAAWTSKYSGYWTLGDKDGASKVLFTKSLKAQVAVVLVQDKSWNEIPFVYRAMISDAAVAAAQTIDKNLLEAEKPFYETATLSGFMVESFTSEQTAQATLQWIREQPEALRDTYSTVYEYVRHSPNGASPSSKPRRGDAGNTIYFATTREDTGATDPRYRFGDARTNVVKCGLVVTSQTDANVAGFQFASAVSADTKSCFDQIKAIAQSSERFLIFVHGIRNRFSDAVDSALALKNTLGNSTDILLWSWPAKRDGLAFDYSYDKESATGIAQHEFAEFLRALRAGGTKQHLNVLAHSMGSWHILGALESVNDQNSIPFLRNIVLAAPDVPRDEFGFALDALSHVSTRSTLYACGWDVALMASENLNEYPRAGTGGSNIFVSDKMDSIDVDAGLGINHDYVFDNKRVLKDVSAVIVTGTNPSDAARGLSEVPKPPWHYWRFP